MTPTQSLILACTLGLVSSALILIILHRQWPHQSRSIWRWITQPVRLLAFVILALGTAAFIEHTLSNRFTYRTVNGGYTMKIDRWTGQEWLFDLSKGWFRFGYED